MENREIPTAEEFIREKIRAKEDIKGKMYGLWKYQVTGEDCLRWAQEYSILKSEFYVKKALEAAARTRRNGFYNSEKEEQSILNAYPLDQIK